jgi:hypothetical protein
MYLPWDVRKAKTRLPQKDEAETRDLRQGCSGNTCISRMVIAFSRVYRSFQHDHIVGLGEALSKAASIQTIPKTSLALCTIPGANAMPLRRRRLELFTAALHLRHRAARRLTIWITA